MRRNRRPSETPLMPREDAREMALFFVVCALCFLAALAALSAKSTYGAATSWTAEVEGEYTVTMEDADRRAAGDAATIIAATDGVSKATVLTRQELEDLLAPNFGARGLPDAMPLPQMIAVTSTPGAIDVKPNIQRRLTEAGFEAHVDAHASWAGDVHRVLGIVRLVALGAMALLASTAVAVIAFATHAALLARRDIVDVLHLSGARDRFIAGLFERRFWVLGLQAGAAGSLMALGAAAAMIYFAQAGGARGGLLPQLSLDFLDLLILVLTPVVAGVASRFAARVTVIRSLKGTL